MEYYFELLSQELLNKLDQIKIFIKGRHHNLTIGILTEEILRDFLRRNLPSIVSVEQGFILNSDGELSKQCDIIIYNSLFYSPFYRVNDVVIVPSESVLAIVEVKTTINKTIFHETINYFASISSFVIDANKYLFIYNSQSIEDISSYLHSYEHPGSYQEFDYDTFEYLPDEITGINESFHLKKDCVITDSDSMGYSSWFFNDSQGTEINALMHFYLSVYERVEEHVKRITSPNKLLQDEMRLSLSISKSKYYKKDFSHIVAIQLFDM